MSESDVAPVTSISKARTLEIAEFWDTHSLADYWDQTEPAEFEFDPQARRHYLVAIDPELLARIRAVARRNGLETESLINLWLERHLQEVAA